ncbi:hypothetical protein EIJ81_00285 (plasmid) [Aliivibrio salmonicida]|uniref:hypothetical protein n=1 Tax=Aliivibrio salmonicida TaxID=40269 RepID=UPI000F7168DD|nr:hypothetical protein [Aliivibrio salmonicida]AZL83340.1 hypothetical protein EIJ81_00285 [Aliivibrio salmonicida]
MNGINDLSLTISLVENMERQNDKRTKLIKEVQILIIFTVLFLFICDLLPVYLGVGVAFMIGSIGRNMMMEIKKVNQFSTSDFLAASEFIEEILTNKALSNILRLRLGRLTMKPITIKSIFF